MENSASVNGKTDYVFQVLTWNVQGIKNYTRTAFDDVAPVIDSFSADILCLQEMPRARDQLVKLKRIRAFHCCISSFNNRCLQPSATPEPFNHNIIVSRYPIKKWGELRFPRTITKQYLEHVTWADITIRGRTIRVYNCHLAIIGVGIRERQQQISFIFKHAHTFPGPVIICGDMNTTIPKKGIKRRLVQWLHDEPDASMIVNGRCMDGDERYSFSNLAKNFGFNDALKITESTWALPPTGYQLFNLKLDWFFTRNIRTNKILYGKYISDHKPIRVTCSF